MAMDGGAPRPRFATHPGAASIDALTTAAIRNLFPTFSDGRRMASRVVRIAHRRIVMPAGVQLPCAAMETPIEASDGALP